jgi:hypothetical protein
MTAPSFRSKLREAFKELKLPNPGSSSFFENENPTTADKRQTIKSKDSSMKRKLPRPRPMVGEVLIGTADIKWRK